MSLMWTGNLKFFLVFKHFDKTFYFKFLLDMLPMGSTKGASPDLCKGVQTKEGPNAISFLNNKNNGELMGKYMALKKM